jgi:hypothetical protein
MLEVHLSSQAGSATLARLGAGHHDLATNAEGAYGHCDTISKIQKPNPGIIAESRNFPSHASSLALVFTNTQVIAKP